MMQVPQEAESDAIAEAANLFKRLSHPARLAIVHYLLGGERSVGEIEAELGLHQPSLSQQLTDLRNAGIILPRRHAKQVYYRLDDARVERVLAALWGRPASLRPLPDPGRRPAPLSAAVFARIETAPRGGNVQGPTGTAADIDRQ